jgi:hypothetical protein
VRVAFGVDVDGVELGERPFHQSARRKLRGVLEEIFVACVR